MTDQPAIPAATLIAWRDTVDGPRILVVERSSTMAFAAGAIVFPGGRIDPQDRELAAALGRPDDAARITAIRETIEESAVAVGLGEIDPAQGPSLQQRLNNGDLLSRVMAENGLTLDLDAVVSFARWKPEGGHARRFDTMFFLARAPAGDWPPVPQDGECVSAEWASPSELLARIAAGTAGAIFPTKRNLERLAQFASFDDVCADALAHPVGTITPWIEEHDGQPHVTIPPDRGYPIIREPLKSAFRA